MAGNNRKLASIQRIEAVRPIDGADRIEIATVEAWECVVGKGEFSAGDEVVYIEIDTFLPEGIPAFEWLQDRGQKEMEHDGHIMRGHVLRTAKFRGAYSQGLVMRQEALGLDPLSHSVGDDVTDEIGVWEYEPVIVNPDAIGAYDTRLAPVTDAMRIQSCPDVWDIMRQVECRASVKVDGTSMTVTCDPADGHIRIFGHHYELSQEAGLGRQAISVCRQQGIISFCESHPGLVVQFEFAGPKVNGNRLGLDAHRAFVFAVWENGRTKVPFEDARLCPGEGFDALRRSACPVLDVSMSQFASAKDAILWAEGLRGNVAKDKLDEGVVFHVMGRGSIAEADWPDAKGRLMGALGEPLEMKIINNRYLMKHRI